MPQYRRFSVTRAKAPIGWVRLPRIRSSSGRTIRGQPVRPQNDLAAPSKKPERALAAPRAFEPAKPIESQRPPLRPQPHITDRAAIARRDPPAERPVDQSVQAVRTPLRWIVPPQVVQEPPPPAPARPETAAARRFWTAAAAAEPPAATAVPDTIVIEIGRIELSPPRPKQTPAPEARRDRSVTLASYLADRRAGRR